MFPGEGEFSNLSIYIFLFVVKVLLLFVGGGKKQKKEKNLVQPTEALHGDSWSICMETRFSKPAGLDKFEDYQARND